VDPGAWERVGYLMDHEAERREEVDYWHMFQVKCTLGYNEFDFFLENEEYRPFDGCKIEI
jgi:hypothetical protein